MSSHVVHSAIVQVTTSTVGSLAKTSSTLNPDKQLRVAQAFAFPIRAWYCIGSFIGFVSLCHFLTLFCRLWRGTSHRHKSATRTRSRDVIQYRRLPAAAMDTFRALAFRWTLPIGKSRTVNATELLLTAAYGIVIFVWSLVHSTAKTGLKYDPHYWANTAGNVVATQIPLITALGMKNNVISLLTGVSFNKLNYLHRMTARVLAVLIWVHAAGRLMLKMSGDTAWTRPQIQCGVLAGTSLSLLSILSLQPLRHRNHELFLIIHFIFAFIFLLGAYFHTQGLLSLGYFIWPSFLIWGLDRLLRALRILIFNFGYFKFKSAAGLDAQIEILSHEFLRITLYRPSSFHWRPGQSVYLTIGGVSALSIEAHPFTISTIDPGLHVVDDPEHSTEGEGVEMDATAVSRSKEGFKQLVFLVKVRNGFTKRLLHAAGLREDKIMRVLVDGPYGSPPLLGGYDVVILIAGGSGVGFTLPLLSDLVRNPPRPTNICQKVVFVWAVRDVGHIAWISDSLCRIVQNIPTSLIIDIRLCITAVGKESHPRGGDSTEPKDLGRSDNDGLDKDSELFRSPAVRLQCGRPDLRQLMKDEIAHAVGDISVNVCGNESLANSVRSALRGPRPIDILRGGPTVTLHVESFGP